MAKFDDLWRNEQTLQAVLDSISDGVLTYNSDLNVTGVNRAAVEILGYPADEIVGKHCTDVFRCGVCDPGWGFSIALASQQPSAHSTVRLHTAEGRERLAVIHTSPIHDPQGRLEGIVVDRKSV